MLIIVFLFLNIGSNRASFLNSSNTSYKPFHLFSNLSLEIYSPRINQLFRYKKRKMTVAEQPCYTLINTSQDLEPPSEMQLREDLEKGNDKVSLEMIYNRLTFFFLRQKRKH
jgi:hypothetical protein